MGRQSTRGSVVWPPHWRHRAVRSQLHVAAGHVIRLVSRHWFIQCPHGDCNGVANVGRSLTLRDVIDDLASHLPDCG